MTLHDYHHDNWYQNMHVRCIIFSIVSWSSHMGIGTRAGALPANLNIWVLVWRPEKVTICTHFFKGKDGQAAICMFIPATGCPGEPNRGNLWNLHRPRSSRTWSWPEVPMGCWGMPFPMSPEVSYCGAWFRCSWVVTRVANCHGFQ